MDTLYTCIFIVRNKLLLLLRLSDEDGDAEYTDDDEMMMLIMMMMIMVMTTYAVKHFLLKCSVSSRLTTYL